jgi:hypothetical protein
MQRSEMASIRQIQSREMDAFERNVNIADEKDNQDRKRKQKENVGN